MFLFLFTNSEIPLKKIFLKNSEKQRIIKIFPLNLCNLYISAQEIRHLHSAEMCLRAVHCCVFNIEYTLNINL